MLSRTLRLSLYFLATIISVAAARADSPDSHPPAAGPTIMIFGDSLTDGNALGANGRDRVWVTLAQRKVGEALTLVNEGKGGRQPI